MTSLLQSPWVRVGLFASFFAAASAYVATLGLLRPPSEDRRGEKPIVRASNIDIHESAIPRLRAISAEGPAPDGQIPRLYGVMTLGGVTLVLLRSTSDEHGRWVGVGDEFEGWRIRKIQRESAEIEAAGKHLELKFYLSPAASQLANK